MALHGSDTSNFQQIDVEGAKLAYTDNGRGQSLVLVHGSLSDIRSWDAVVPLFASKLRVVAYSRRYAWPNDEIVDGAPDPWGKSCR